MISIIYYPVLRSHSVLDLGTQARNIQTNLRCLQGACALEWNFFSHKGMKIIFQDAIHLIDITWLVERDELPLAVATSSAGSAYEIFHKDLEVL